ncbi:hypothetical protein PC120_g9830 [Phytophthora cactorum]|nr:hypothetical protein PC120_g9830 [Phytophthora cactorum]
MFMLPRPGAGCLQSFVVESSGKYPSGRAQLGCGEINTDGHGGSEVPRPDLCWTVQQALTASAHQQQVACSLLFFALSVEAMGATSRPLLPHAKRTWLPSSDWKDKCKLLLLEARHCEPHHRWWVRWQYMYRSIRRMWRRRKAAWTACF